MELTQSQPTPWTRSTIEELLNRQAVGCSRGTDCGIMVRADGPIAGRGVFRPGLRVVVLDDSYSDPWEREPAGVTIEG